MPGTPERERRLVLACLVRRPRAALVPLLEGIDWDAALALAGRHAVLESVSHALLGAVAGELAAAARAALTDAGAGAAARNTMLLHDLGRAQEALRAAGVRSVALKGAAVLAAPGAAVGMRHLSDVDLLVAPADLSRAAAALAGAGLAPPAGMLPGIIGGTGLLARSPGGAHVRQLATWGGGALELHDRLPGGGPPAAEVVAAAVERSFAGRRLDVAAPDDLAGMLCRHVFLAHGHDPRLRARHVADLAFLEGTVDWPRVEARWGGLRGGAALGGSRALLAAAAREVDEGVRAPPRLGLLEAEAEPPPSTAGRVIRLGLRAPVHFLFPSREYMEARFGVRRGSPWTPLLYPWRLVRAVVLYGVRSLGRQR
jgi:hypothetical protein